MPASTAADAQPAASRQRSAPEPHGSSAAMATARNSKQNARVGPAARRRQDREAETGRGRARSRSFLPRGGQFLHGSQRSGKRCADESEDNGGDSDESQIAQQRLRGRARAAQSGIDERHAGNGQRRKQQECERERENGVAHLRLARRPARCGGIGIHGRLAPRGSMWPRTATTRPMPSTARPHSTNAARRPAIGKQHQRGEGEKESGGHHQQSGVLHSLSFSFVGRQVSGGHSAAVNRSFSGNYFHEDRPMSPAC